MEQKEIPPAGKAPGQNRLLAALPRKDFQRLAQHLEPVDLAFGEVLHEPGGRIRHAYFPLSGLVSLLTVVGQDKAAEFAIVGNEGVIGASAALGIDTSSLRAVVQGAGTALRITASRLKSEFGAHPVWYVELLRFTNALMHQAAQSAACNRFHPVEPRLARWLLSTRDRLHSNHFQITQEFLSQMLGVRRVGVTEAAANLQKKRLIIYSRGKLQLLDPAGLEAAACECYGAVKAMYRRSYKA